ncbi:hypothetical protein GYMLUDRAFT_50615 [Collybiopsis luxurians FD-317 M1]|uniref:Nephrocystin 3-like N-terminal domain-containing protein n=1 Tax=Collybiopsis luxurians FD-317 M1 TaxID=944289 RepID=A0A0D0BP14_9AGAR|nr:hypothetical protein GYMLUDRAFT_50615 [Collybiopsis luxurians FD-317 M1]
MSKRRRSPESDAHWQRSVAPPGSILSGAYDFVIQGSHFNAANEIHYHYGKDKIDHLKEKLNLIINPVKKKVSCMEGTRITVLNELCEWVLKPDSRMAWIHGLAGSGKSAIAVTLAEKLRKLKNKVSLAVTFHCIKGQGTSDTSILVPLATI